MAEENLGTAVLRIVVDDDQARDALNLLKRDVEATARQADRARRTAATSTTAKGGAREATDAVERANQRIIGVQNRINLLEAKGVDITQLRARLSQAIAANEQRNFGSVKQITAQLSNSLKIEEGRLRVSAAQTAELKRQQQAAPKERVTSQKPSGVGLTTTPEQIIASRGGAQKGAAESIDALTNAKKRLYKIEQQVQSLEAAGVNTAKIRADLRKAEYAKTTSRFGTANKIADELEATLRQERDKLRVIREQNKVLKEQDDAGRRIGRLNASPVRGGAGFPGSPAFFERQARAEEKRERERIKAERQLNTEKQKSVREQQRADNARQRARQSERQALSGALSSAVIGGAFPLLFGQGGGAAAGGLVGGLFGSAAGQGGGFAGSLAGTLIGQQLDIFNQLAKALQDPVTNFKQLVEASNLSSKGLESYVQVLIDLGRTAEAEAAIRKDISRTVDPVTLAQASAANDQYARTIADVQERLGTILAGPSSRFVTWLEDIVKRIAFLPSPDRAPISDEGRQRLSLANRGAGTALGLAGIGIAGLSAVTGFFPGVLAGGAIAATGGAQFGLGESQQEQVGLSKILKGAQQEILAIEKKRIEAQRQLVALAEQNAPGQKELTFQVSLLDVEAKRAKAKADFLARDVSTESFQAYKLELEALKLTEKQLRANEALRLRALGAQRTLNSELSEQNLAGINKQISSTQALRKAEQGLVRDTLSTTQEIEAGIDAAKRRQSAVESQLKAARTVGDQEQVSSLVGKQKEAAAEVRLELEKGALSLQEAAERLVKLLKEATVTLTEVRSDPRGLNRFLPQFAINQRAEEDFAALLPLFREAQDRFTELTGFNAPEFIGRTSGVNEAIRDFIKTVNVEGDANKQIADINQALAEVTSKLAEVNTELNTSVASLSAGVIELTKKDWNVYINANYTGSSNKELLDAVNF